MNKASARNAARTASPCPCGKPLTYAGCCGVYHGGLPAPDAEALMRSRYSAYVQRDEAYLRATWDPATAPGEPLFEADGGPKWIGLTVLRHQITAPDEAVVEFVARCRVGGRAQRLHEISRFVRRDGRWYYVAGDHPAD